MKTRNRLAAAVKIPAGLLLFLAGSCWLGAQETEGDGEEVEKPNEAALALKALVDFVTAESWEDAAKLALDAEVLRPRMEAHYERFEWKPISEPEIRYDRSTKVTGDIVYFTHDFEVREKNSGDLPVLLTVVQAGESFLVDWEIFAQLRDNSFETFVKEQITDAMSFRVSGVRGVPGGKEAELPLEGGVERLRIRWRPSISEAVSVFTGKSTDAGKAIVNIASWRSYRPFRVEARWVVDGETSFIELTKIEPINFRTPSVVSPSSP